jgi:hypothetical protein
MRWIGRWWVLARLVLMVLMSGLTVARAPAVAQPAPSSEPAASAFTLEDALGGARGHPGLRRRPLGWKWLGRRAGLRPNRRSESSELRR